MRRWHGDETVGEAAQFRATLRATCRTCTHDTYFDARGLLHVVKPDKRLDALRFTCSECGGKEVDFRRVHLESGSGLTPVYVIRFVRGGCQR